MIPDAALSAKSDASSSFQQNDLCSAIEQYKTALKIASDPTLAKSEELNDFCITLYSNLTIVLGKIGDVTAVIEHASAGIELANRTKAKTKTKTTEIEKKLRYNRGKAVLLRALREGKGEIGKNQIRDASEDLMRSGIFEKPGSLEKFIEECRRKVIAEKRGKEGLAAMLGKLPKEELPSDNDLRKLANNLQSTMTVNAKSSVVKTLLTAKHIEKLLSIGNKHALLCVGILCDYPGFVAKLAALSKWEGGQLLLTALGNVNSSDNCDDNSDRDSDSENIPIIVGSIVKKVIAADASALSTVTTNEIVAYLSIKGGGFDVVNSLCELQDKSILRSFCAEGGIDAILSVVFSSGELFKKRRQAEVLLARIVRVFCTAVDDVNEEEQAIVEEIFSPVLSRVVDVDGEKIAEEKDEEGLRTILDVMKLKGCLVSGLFLGHKDVGLWALRKGWKATVDGTKMPIPPSPPPPPPPPPPPKDDDSNKDESEESEAMPDGVIELLKMVSSSTFSPTSGTIVSDVIASASSSDSGRAILTPIVETGALSALLQSDDRETQSGAASALAKIGLAAKVIGKENEETGELLKVAIDLLGAEGGMERGVEVLCYLCSKTALKEEIVHGSSRIKSPLAKIIAVARGTSEGVDPSTSYGLANVFSLLTVSIEELRKEAFRGKDVTEEQYDQMQKMAKIEGEDAETAKEMDPAENVNARIRVMVAADAVKAVVKLAESGGQNTKEKCAEALCRIATEQGGRGVMIQQGALSCCIKLGGEEATITPKTNELARHAIAKMLVTTNPGLLTATQRLGSVSPLLKFCKNHESTNLGQFECLLSLTNLLSGEDDVKNKFVNEGGIGIVNFLMFEDHEMVRRAACECLSNLVTHPKMIEYFRNPEKIRIWVAFLRDYEEDFETARAATSGLAMACADEAVRKNILTLRKKEEEQKDKDKDGDGDIEGDGDIDGDIGGGDNPELVGVVGLLEILESGNLDLMHRAFYMVKMILSGDGATADRVNLLSKGISFIAQIASAGDITAKQMGLDERGAAQMKTIVGLAQEILKAVDGVSRAVNGIKKK